MLLALIRALLVTHERTYFALVAVFEPDLLVTKVAECGTRELDAHEAMVAFLYRATAKDNRDVILIDSYLTRFAECIKR